MGKAQNIETNVKILLLLLQYNEIVQEGTPATYDTIQHHVLNRLFQVPFLRNPPESIREDFSIYQTLKDMAECDGRETENESFLFICEENSQNFEKKRKILKADLIYNEIMKADKKRRDQQTRNRNKKGQHRGKKEEI